MDAHHKYTLYNEHCTLYCVYVYTVNNVKYTCIVNSVLVCCITATMQAIQCLGIAMIMKLVLYIYIYPTPFHSQPTALNRHHRTLQRGHDGAIWMKSTRRSPCEIARHWHPCGQWPKKKTKKRNSPMEELELRTMVVKRSMIHWPLDYSFLHIIN